MAINDEKELKLRILNEPEFVNLKRYDYSLLKLLERYQDSTIPDRVIAQALGLSEQELAETYARLVAKLRATMGVTL